MLAKSEFKTGTWVTAVTMSNYRVQKSLELVHRRTLKEVDRTTCLGVVSSVHNRLGPSASIINYERHP